MHDEVSAMMNSGPLAGLTLASVGFFGYCYTTFTKVLAAPDSVFAQVAPQSTDTAQMIYGVLAVVGGLIAWGTVQWSKINEGRREEARKDAEMRRDESRKDADVERDQWLKDQFARLQVSIAHHQATTHDHLRLQDDVLSKVKEAVQGLPTTTPTGNP